MTDLLEDADAPEHAVREVARLHLAAVIQRGGCKAFFLEPLRQKSAGGRGAGRLAPSRHLRPPAQGILRCRTLSCRGHG
jgi:hypothetical protein